MLYSSLSTNKLCTTLFWSNTLSFFLIGQTKLGKECFNSFFCLVRQTKSFSMSKCINPRVDDVTCSIKNLVSSPNLLFYVLTKICFVPLIFGDVKFPTRPYIVVTYKQYLPVSIPAPNFTLKILVHKTMQNLPSSMI